MKKQAERVKTPIAQRLGKLAAKISVGTAKKTGTGAARLWRGTSKAFDELKTGFLEESSKN